MLAPGFTYEVDQVGAIRFVPDLDQKAGCYYTKKEWQAEQEAKARRFAVLGWGFGGCAFPKMVSRRIGRSTVAYGDYDTWAAVVKAYEKRGNIARAVWFDADLTPTVFRVQDGHVEITMPPEECLAAAKQRIGD